MWKRLFSIIFFLSCQLQAYELSIGSMFRNEATYLKEWIEFHLKAGVDHFWLYDNGSTDNWEEVLEPYMDAGIVEVKYWPTLPGMISWVDAQIQAFVDAIKQAKGKAKWLAIIDIDEFLLPMQDSTIPECLGKHFSEFSAVYVNWRNFGTGGVYIPKNETILDKLFACSLPSHPDNGIGKSIVKPEDIDLENIWYPHHFPLKPGKIFVQGNRQKMVSEGRDWFPDGGHHDQFLRINHYVLRDEGFYRTSRVPAAQRGGHLPLLLEHYESFSRTKDYSMLNYIQNNFEGKEPNLWVKR